MFRVTSLTEMPEAQLNRLLKRLGLLLVVGIVAFVAFYAVDRWKPATAPIVDREVSALEAAVTKDPSDLASRGRLADIYVAKGRYQDAIDQYGQILKTGKADTAAHLGRGTAERLFGQLDAAATDYQAVVSALAGTEMANVDPALESAYVGLGTIDVAQQKPADAIDPLTKALAITRTDADALEMLGTAYVDSGEPAKAVDPLRKAASFVPVGWADPYQELAKAYTASGDTAHAEWAGAMADLAGGKTADAERRLTAITDGPAAVDVAIGMGLLNETRGDLPSATTWYAKALAADPGNAVAQMGLNRVEPAPSGAIPGHDTVPSSAPNPAASPAGAAGNS
jgi:tetratricopeptide (TPR) repeat protein